MALVLLCVLVAGCTPQPAPTATASPPPATATPVPAQPTAVPTAAPTPVAWTVTGNTSVPLPEATPPPPIKGAWFYGYHITPMGFIEYYHMDSWWEPADKFPMGSKAFLSVSLIKNSSLWLGGDMYAEWWKGDEKQTCDVIVIYQRGICEFYADGYEPGVFVPVTATIHYLDRYYTLHTGFTPQ